MRGKQELLDEVLYLSEANMAETNEVLSFLCRLNPHNPTHTGEAAVILNWLVADKIEERFPDSYKTAFCEIDDMVLALRKKGKKLEADPMKWAKKHRTRLSLLRPESLIDDLTSCEKGQYMTVRSQLAKACECKTGNDLFGPILGSILLERVDVELQAGIDKFVAAKDYSDRATRASEMEVRGNIQQMSGTDKIPRGKTAKYSYGGWTFEKESTLASRVRHSFELKRREVAMFSQPGNPTFPRMWNEDEFWTPEFKAMILTDAYKDIQWDTDDILPAVTDSRQHSNALMKEYTSSEIKDLNSNSSSNRKNK